MGRIEKFLCRFPLKIAYSICVAVFIIIAVFLSLLTSNAAKKEMLEIEQKYSIDIPDISYSEKTEDSAFYYYNFDLNAPELSKEDSQLYKIYGVIYVFSPFFWSSVCLVCSALVFNKCVLKKPLGLLLDASKTIAEKSFDFELLYSGSNELAELCHSFNDMAKSLAQNTQELQTMIEEKKKLNDAYSHELRTPVAVLKGYADMILEYIPDDQMCKEELLETMKIMANHIDRIAAFSDSMNTIQKLENITIIPKEIEMADFLGNIKKCTEMMGNRKEITLEYEDDMKNKTVLIDTAAVSQVYENMLDNALRYALQNISVRFSFDGDLLSVTVSDDGCGFSEKEIETAGQCYYSSKDSEGGYHLGLGLYIAGLLCEKHGGKLTIGNSESGGAKITATFCTDSYIIVH